MPIDNKTIKTLKPGEKRSDGGGLYIYMLTSGTKVWQMGYRFGGKQRTLSIGIYPEVSIDDAREARHEARKLLAKGIDPHAAHMEEAAEERAKETKKTFADHADDWLAKERKEKQAAKTLSGKTNRIKLLKARFGKLALNEIAREDVLAFLRTFEATGNLETRDRVRSNGESIFNYGTPDDTDVLNPFRPFDKEKLIKNESAPRPAMTEPADVARLLKLIAPDRQDTRLDEVVSLALRFIALTAVRPGELISAEWCDIDLDAKEWRIPESKMKMKRVHIVPLSAQALVILRRLHDLTGGDKWVFTCAGDKPISDNTLNRRLRWLGIETTMHCAHGFRSTFSTLLNGECTKEDVKIWDGDLIELQLAHIETGTVKAIYNRVGPTALIGARAKMMQHWADKIDAYVASGVAAFRKKEIAA